jgi:hypothetical protein
LQKIRIANPNHQKNKKQEYLIKIFILKSINQTQQISISKRICKPVHSLDKVANYHLDKSWAFGLVVLNALDYFKVAFFGEA